MGEEKRPGQRHTAPPKTVNTTAAVAAVAATAAPATVEKTAVLHIEPMIMSRHHPERMKNADDIVGVILAVVVAVVVATIAVGVT